MYTGRNIPRIDPNWKEKVREIFREAAASDDNFLNYRDGTYYLFAKVGDSVYDVWTFSGFYTKTMPRKEPPKPPVPEEKRVPLTNHEELFDLEWFQPELLAEEFGIPYA